eukprot:1463934-Pyramimonas_sp.AAC.1
MSRGKHQSSGDALASLERDANSHCVEVPRPGGGAPSGSHGGGCQQQHRERRHQCFGDSSSGAGDESGKAERDHGAA